MKVLVSGASGLIGSELVSYLRSKGHEVYSLVRFKEEKDKEFTVYFPLNVKEAEPHVLNGFDGIVNLAGENIVSLRWTEEKKRKILESRVNSTRQLAESFKNIESPPKVWVNASAIGYYGNTGDEWVSEKSPSGEGFLAHVCKEWEKATEGIDKGIRVVISRTGLVLTPKGGTLGTMLIPFKLGLGGKIGSGNQYMSWITLEDIVRVIEFALTNDNVSGPINAVTNHPVTNKEFTKILGEVLKRPTFLSMPAWVTRLVFGEMADEMFLASCRVRPDVLMSHAFILNQPVLKEALRF